MRNKTYIYLLLLIFVMVFSHIMMRRSYSLPYPHFDSLSTKESPIPDVSGIVMGARNATADIAWIQLIEYVGEVHIDKDEHQEDEPGGQKTGPDLLENLKSLTNRVVHINPFMNETYLFSSGLLAWYVNRPDEALEILTEGVRNNPRFWQLRIYIGAISYKKINEFGKMITYLEEAVKYKDCPVIIKSILANSYKKQKQYLKAITIWESIIETNGDQYKDMARREIGELKRLANSSQP